MEKIYGTATEMKKGTKRFLAIALAALMMFTNLGDITLGVVALASEGTATRLPLIIDPEALQEKLDAIVDGRGGEAELILPSYGDGEEGAALDQALRDQVNAWRENKLLLDVVTYGEDANVVALVAVTADGNTITGLSITGINTGHGEYAFATSLSGAGVAAARLTTVKLEVEEIPVGASSVAAETPEELPVETPKELPVETPEELPVETPEELPVETPKELPVETPAEIPVETSEEAPAESSGEAPQSLVASSVVSRTGPELPVGASGADGEEDDTDDTGSSNDTGSPSVQSAFEVKAFADTKALDQKELDDLSGFSAGFFSRVLDGFSYNMPVGAGGIASLDITPAAADGVYRATATLYDYHKDAINDATEAAYVANPDAYPKGAMYFGGGGDNLYRAGGGFPDHTGGLVAPPQNNWWQGGAYGPYQGLVQPGFVEGGIAFNGVAQFNFFDGLTDNVKDAYAGVAFPFTLGSDGYYSYDSNSTKLTYSGSSNSLSASSYQKGDTKGFFPFGTATDDQKFATGLQMSIPFVMREGGLMANGKAMIFEFTGDDDIWIFIDGKLVLDMGGLNGVVHGGHGPSAADVPTGTINFATGKVTYSRLWAEGPTRVINVVRDIGVTLTENSVHNMQIFYMERGETDSNCKIKFALETLPSGSVTVNKQVLGDEPADAKYDFALYTGDSADSLEPAKEFALSAGESFTFDNLASGTYYKVTEAASGGFDTYWSVDVSSGFQKSNETDVMQVNAAGATLVTFTNTYSAASSPSLDGHKTITDRREGGKYEITVSLDPRNGFETIENPIQMPKPAQVVLVMDLSDSMKWPMEYNGNDQTRFVGDNDPTQRWYVLRHAAASFIESVLGNGNPGNNQIAIVGYASGGANAGVIQGYTSDIDALTASFLDKSLESVRSGLGITGGGTHGQAGLNAARKLVLGSADPSRDQYVVFMTDGEADESSRWMDSIDWGSGADDRQRAVNVAAWIKNDGKDHMNGRAARIFSVGITGDLSANAQSMLKNIASGDTAPFYLHGGNTLTLTEALDTVAGEITRYQFTTLRNHNVVLTDVMSSQVDLVHADGSAITAADPFTEGDVIKSHDIGAVSYDPAARTLTWSIPGTVRPLHYTLTYRVNVRTPEGSFQSGSGDSGTQLVSNDPYTALEPDSGSARYPASASAVITSDDAAPKTLPVPQVWQKANTVKLKKVDQNNNSLQGVEFKVYRSDDLTAPVLRGSTGSDGVVELKLYDYSYTIRETTPAGYQGVGDITVDFAGKEGKFAHRTAAINPGDSASLETNGTASSVITVKNVLKTDGGITVTKVVQDANGDTLAIPSGLYVALFADAQGQNLVAGSLREIPTGGARPGRVEYTGLSYGTYYVFETDARGVPVDGSFQYEVAGQGAVVVDSAAPKAITITNTPKTGAGLVLNKVLDGNGLTNETFGFTLDGGSNGFAAYGEVTGSGAVAWYDSDDAGTRKAISVATLPVGSYTLTENAPAPTSHFRFEKFTVDGVDVTQGTGPNVTYPNKVSFDVAGGGTTAILVTARNAVKTDGSIRVSKEMAPGSVVQAPGQLFTFDLYQGTYHGDSIQWSSSPVDTLEIQAGRNATFTGLAYGVPYQVRERLSANSVYQLVSFSGGGETFEFVPAPGGDSAATTATNLTKLGDLNVRKYGRRGSSTSYLGGAGFTLYRYDGGSNSTVVREQLMTNESGYLSFQGLPVGKYVLRETRVPSGYRAPAESSIVVELQADTEGRIIAVAGADVVMEDENTVVLVNTYLGGRDDDDDDDDDDTITITDPQLPLGPGITIVDPLLPLGNLPNAGGLPVGVLGIIGSGLALAGWAIGKKSGDGDDNGDNGREE